MFLYENMRTCALTEILFLGHQMFKATLMVCQDHCLYIHKQLILLVNITKFINYLYNIGISLVVS